jgi:ElaB/YqjD/DUF883 family membrane-anchored ribosome-binding protein
MLTEALSDLQQLLQELDKLLTHSGGDVAGQAQKAVADWHHRAKAVHQRLSKLQGQAQAQVRTATKAVEESLQDNPWRAVAIAALAGLLVGLALGPRERSSGAPAPATTPDT